MDDLLMFIYSDNNGVTNYSQQAFINAKNAGLKVQIGMAPCRPVSPQDIATDLINKLGYNTIERVWLFPLSFF